MNSKIYILYIQLFPCGVIAIPIRRKIFRLGNSDVITLPASWRQLVEKETGKRVTEVAIEINTVLKIYPIVDGVILREKIPE